MRLHRPIDWSKVVRVSWHFTPPTHVGLDLSCVVGTPIYAAVDGVAYNLVQEVGFGKYVRIENGKLKVYTAHLDQVFVVSGSTVKRGDLIGLSGNTGTSSGPHLHFEVRNLAGSPYTNYAIDPWPLIDWEERSLSTRVGGVHLGNGVPLSDTDKDTIKKLRPGMVTFLPSYSLSQQPVTEGDIRWILSVVPDCHIIVRPYVTPSMVSTDAGCREYITDVKAIVPLWASIIPEGQFHLQLWNEQNMPLWSGGYEGFGDQPADMLRFNRMFVEGYRAIKAVCATVIIGWTPLTIGNRDVWFKGDAVGDYYLHGPLGCVEPEVFTHATWLKARETAICYESLLLADEHYHHIYLHHNNNDWSNLAYGLRFERYQFFWPEKTVFFTEYGHPNKHFLDMQGAQQALIDETQYLNDNSNIKGTSLWILGNNPDWGGQMYTKDSPAIIGISAINAQASIPEVNVPYFHSYRDNNKVAYIVLHDTEGTATDAESWFRNPANPSKSSSHKIVTSGGDIMHLIPDELAAHHAGLATIPGVTVNVNLVSLGLELEYPKYPASPAWPKAQIDSAAIIVKDWVRKFGITRAHVVRHGTIDPTRRTDPRNWDEQGFLNLVFGPLEEAIGKKIADNWQAEILPLNADAALYKAAIVKVPGAIPASDEFYPEDGIVAQFFRTASDLTKQYLLWTRVGEWDASQVRVYVRAN